MRGRELIKCAGVSIEKSWARKDKLEILDIGSVDGSSWQGEMKVLRFLGEHSL